MIFCFGMPAAVKCFGVIPAAEYVLHIPPTNRLVRHCSHHASSRHVGFYPLKYRFRVIDK